MVAPSGRDCPSGYAVLPVGPCCCPCWTARDEFPVGPCCVARRAVLCCPSGRDVPAACLCPVGPCERRYEMMWLDAMIMSLCLETMTPITIVLPLVPITMVLERKTKVQTLYM